MKQPDLTPTEQRLYDALQSGAPQTRERLLKCLDDPLSEAPVLHVHLSLLRRKIESVGLSVLCRVNGKTYYRLVRFISQDD